MKTLENSILKQPVIDLELVQSENKKLQAEIVLLKEQLEWLKKLVFGKKSEKIIQPADPGVMYLPGLEPYFLNDEGGNENSQKTMKRLSLVESRCGTTQML